MFHVCLWLIRGYSATLFKRKLRAKAWKRAQNRLYNLIETRKYGESMVHSWPHIEVTICQVQGFWYTFCKKPCTLNSHFCPLTLAGQWLWGCGVLPNLGFNNSLLNNDMISFVEDFLYAGPPIFANISPVSPIIRDPIKFRVNDKLRQIKNLRLSQEWK